MQLQSKRPSLIAEKNVHVLKKKFGKIDSR